MSVPAIVHKIAPGSRLPFSDNSVPDQLPLPVVQNDSSTVSCGRYWELRRPPRHGLGSIIEAMSMAVHTDEAAGASKVNHSWWPMDHGGGDHADDVQGDLHSEGMRMSAVSN